MNCECKFPKKSVNGPSCLSCNLPIIGEGTGPKIPENIVNLIKDVLELCKKQGCSSVDFKLNPGWRNSFHSQVQVQWSNGRHGTPSSCAITTQLITNLEV